MPIEIKMPALSPTMEEGTLAKWLVKEGDTVASGDILAEIETDKATMEFETIDEGVVTKLLVTEGSAGVKVGATIAIITAEGDEESGAEAPKPSPAQAKGSEEGETGKESAPPAAPDSSAPQSSPRGRGEGAASAPASDRVKASPLARRLAETQGVDLATIDGSGPNGRIVKADLDGKVAAATAPKPAEAPVAAKPAQPIEEAEPAAKPAPAQAVAPDGIPAETVKLSTMRKVIAKRLTEAKQTIPHIYLTVDIRLDALLKLRGQLNAGLEGRGIKLSVNDLLIKAQAMALVEVPACNVMYGGDTLTQYKRADISVAVSIPGGLITPIVTSADTKSVSAIAVEIKELAEKARAGKLQPHEYQGGTASISNMGMFGIKSFDAVINPPQAMILAIGAGEPRPYVIDGSLQIATVMSATGSFDHRAIDGADGARFMAAFKRLVENPLGMLA